jgi:hypothetical protein
MSEREPNPGCPWHADAAPYVLGALDDAEPYREHLETCASCQQDVAELQVAADILPTAVATERAPRALVDSVLVTVRSEAQLLRAAGPQADQPSRPESRWRSRPAALLIAGVGLAAVAAAAAAIVLGGGSSAGERVIKGTVLASAPGAKAFLRQSAGQAELVVSRISQPALGKVYEVWLGRASGAPQPTDALFSVTSQGDGSVDVPDNLHAVKEVMVTSEPLGGSSHPTSPPIIRIVLPT